MFKLEQNKVILDWDKYIKKAVEVNTEGIVMLKNERNALPLKKSDSIALFGRMQLHYVKSGIGSGGMVNVSYVTGVPEGISEIGGKLDEIVLESYKKWDSENPIKNESGWATSSFSQEEMPLDESFCEEASKRNSAAVVVISRIAGEELDLIPEKGSYYLSDSEKDMLTKVRKSFKRMILLLNVSGIIDMSEIENISPDSILYIWQGGMTGGTAVAKVLYGKSPSGKLPDTIAKSLSDYPAYENFNTGKNIVYAEDIFVGYRYFETFAPEKILYPFGFGLSYTTFDFKVNEVKITRKKVKFKVNVKNTGKHKGKEVIEIYFSAPCGKLGKSARELIAFDKTGNLAEDESETLSFAIDINNLTSYDDFKHEYILEKGEYKFYIGTDSHSAEYVTSFIVKETRVIKRCLQAMPPVKTFERLINANGKKAYEDVPFMDYDETERRFSARPYSSAYEGDKGIKLCDVKQGKNTMDEFLSELSDEDLSVIIRGEGMGSPKVTAGTAAAFAGVSDKLISLGIPSVCCDDGPSGMRLDCGNKAFSLPIGTLIASTFNKKLVTGLFEYLGLEMKSNKVDCLLGPGMNIHRHVLCGRNFEYFSEDPFLTGMIASAELKGLKKSGVSGTIKHFCANNRENDRRGANSIISERALREIYLKGFEIAVKSGYADSIMTTYGSVNGLWTAGNYDLITVILRGEWGFKGIVMTDWWAGINRRGYDQKSDDFAAMAAAGNDLYMVVADSTNNNDNTLEELKTGYITRGELLSCARHILEYSMNTVAYKRLYSEDEEVEIINKPDDDIKYDENVFTFEIDEKGEVDGKIIPTEKGTNFAFIANVKTPGKYKVTITASSNASEVSQIPVTIFSMGSACRTFTWNGTGGKDVSFDTDIFFFSHYTTLRLYFAQGGLDIKNLTFEKVSDMAF